MYYFLRKKQQRTKIAERCAAVLVASLVAAPAPADNGVSKQSRLIIDTATLPAFDRSMTVFAFRLSGPRLTTPVLFESGSRDQWTSGPLDAGRYLLEQSVPGIDWQFSDIDCGTKQVWSGVIALDAGETVRCTVTNKRAGRVIVKSRTQPLNSAADFDFSLINARGESHTVTVEPDSSANIVAHAGTYTLRENRRDGWATQINCQNGDTESVDRRVIVAPGATVVCTAVNTYVELAEPGISIDVSPDDQAAVAGNSAPFTVTVTNTGNVDLSNITINSADVPNCNRTIGRIRAAAPPVSYTCSAENLRAGLTNRLSANTAEGARAYVSARVFLVDKLNPSVRVLVEANRNTVAAGNPVRFSITVINTGNTPLTDIRMDSAQVPNCSRTVAKIPVGNRMRYQCTRWSAASTFRNVVTATTFEGATGSGTVRVEVVSGKNTKS